jgi:preprotein translocase subunit Sss1
VIASYHKKVAIVAVDKSKLMYLVYCLLGLIAFLVSLLMTLILKK